MSKQSDAKAAQGYDPTPSARTCGKCLHFKSELRLASWMEKANGNRRVPLYTLAKNGIESTFKCGLGDFAIKKTAVCDQFAARHQAP